MWVYQVPNDVFEKLIYGLLRSTARSLLGQRAVGGPEAVLHPGDPFGTVIAWCWKEHPDEAVAYVGDLLAEVRYHAPGSDKTITLGELLDGLTFAMPNEMPGTELRAMIARMTAEIPHQFGSDVTSKPGIG